MKTLKLSGKMKVVDLEPKRGHSADSHAGQHSDENGPFEVFWSDETDPCGAGWYWWSCHPGCLPDGDSHGPFDTSEAAYNDAKDEDKNLAHERECSDRMENGDY